MCTALCYRSHGVYAGRHLDWEGSFGECLTLMPRGFSFPYRAKAARRERGYALLGVAFTPHSVPLYFDAVNEKGLYMAGLHFPRYAVYSAPASGAIAPFELIPYVLSRCETVEQARALLSTTTLAHIAYSEELALTPMHWFLADERESAVVEPLEDGLHIAHDPADVLTNSPPLSYQLTRLADYTSCTPKAPSSQAMGVPVSLYSGGLGACGLPGDWSSCSRFVRASYASHAIAAAENGEEGVASLFAALDTVRVPKGCVRTENGKWMHTVYTGGCDLRRGVYYYRRGGAFSPRAVTFREADIHARALVFF